mgnify:CR=1 FL=1
MKRWKIILGTILILIQTILNTTVIAKVNTSADGSENEMDENEIETINGKNGHVWKTKLPEHSLARNNVHLPGPKCKAKDISTPIDSW